MEKTRKKQKIKACAAVNTAAKGVVSSAKKSKMTASEAGEVVKFNEADMPQLDVWLEDETIWLTQKQMGLLFGCAPQNITYHLREIYRIGELEMPSTCKEFLQVQIEGDGMTAAERSIDTILYTLMPALPEEREPIGFHA